MTTRTGKEAAIWKRGFAPAGFLVLLFTLFLSQFCLPENEGAGHAQRVSAEGGIAPSPLSGGADDLWLPASHAERRAVKAKTGLPEGEAGGKALAPAAGALFHPFETAFRKAFPAAGDRIAARAAPASFRSRAPPALAV